MAKKSFDNVTKTLEEQAKQRFAPSAKGDHANKENYDIIEAKKELKKQKTIYLNETMFKLLKKASYIKDLDQSEIVAIALEKYFENEGIYLENGK